MIRAGTVKPAGTWLRESDVDQVILDYDHRSRRRITMTSTGGLEILIDLPHASVLGHGDALLLDNGGCVEVVAADEALAEIICEDVHALARIAWHLGNRHLPVQIIGTTIRIRHDHVIEELMVRLGAQVTQIEAPFDPEGGAYGEGQVHGHSH